MYFNVVHLLILKNNFKLRLLLISTLILFNIYCCAQSPNISFSLLANYGTPVVGIENVGDSRLFLIDKLGTIGIIDTLGTVYPTPFLDVSSQITTNGERGLLGLAFHPNYATNGYFYVNYTDINGDTKVSRFSVSAGNPNQANPSSEQVILAISQPNTNHNGGDLAFGPDGYLYIATGDGGYSGDPNNNGQDPQTLLGNILRINVDNGNPYSIPLSNPFVGNPNGLNEIWSYGLRNPWRISFDQLTGDLWIADVGQSNWEEVNFQPSTSTGGENYGWRCYEGNNAYINNANCPAASSLTFPVSEYPHIPSIGGYSITGGFVYRGNQYPCLYGKYICMDYVTDHLWTIEPDGTGGWNTNFYDANNFSLGSSIVSFGQDAKNELYASSYSGDIYKVEADCNVNSQLDVKVLLEGTYNSGGQMYAKLGSIIPLNQPYSAAPYNYAGTESLASIPSNMVDWVLVELRSGTPSLNLRNTVTAFTKAAMLLADGSIVETDGNPLTFSLPMDADYHIVIRHRNHLDVFSQNTFTSGNNATFDFTAGQNMGLGANPMKILYDGRTALYAGDFVPDHTIQNTDADLWQLSPAILYSYNYTDSTLDGIVQVTDFDCWYRNRSILGNAELDY